MRLTLVVGGGLLLFLLAFSPGTIEGSGYNREILAAGQQLASWLIASIGGPWSDAAAVAWPRHGAPEVLLQLPFHLVSRLIFGDSVRGAGAVMVMQPVMATVAIALVLLHWSWQLTGSRRRALLISVGGTLGTMLWPYASIGMETSQSACLLGAAWMVMGRRGGRSLKATAGFATLAGLALSVKSNGLFLAPAVAFLIWHYLYDGQGDSAQVRGRGRVGHAIAITTIILGWLAIGVVTRAAYWSSFPGGNFGYLRSMMTDSPVTALTQFWQLLVSPNKGLLIYSPPLIPAVFALASALRGGREARRPIAVFALLTLIGLAAGASIVRVWSDETWGPRYLHSAIAPLLLCLSFVGQGRRWPEVAMFATTFVAGLAISLLGSLFYYGQLHRAMIESSQSTLGAIQYAPEWNHIRFNARLARIRLSRPAEPQYWPPDPEWWFEPPPDSRPARKVDLRQLAVPQPRLLK